MNSIHLEYGRSLYCDDIKLWATRCLKSLPAGTEHLVSAGSSGCALASAMLALSENPLTHLCLFMKSGNSHRGYTMTGRSRGVPSLYHASAYVFVDDLIDTGTTLESVRTTLHTEHATLTAAVVCRLDWVNSARLDQLRKLVPIIIAGESQWQNY